MRTVYKYPISIRGDFALSLPQGAQVIHFEALGGKPTIWAIVDTEAIVGARLFHLAGTGHPVPDGLRHVGSCFHGPFVWHLFEPVLYLFPHDCDICGQTFDVGYKVRSDDGTNGDVCGQCLGRDEDGKVVAQR